MPKQRSIVQKITSAAIFIILEIAALNMLRNNGVIQNFFISKQIHAFMGTVWGGSESIKYYFSLKKVNEELAQENLMLLEKIKGYEDSTGMTGQDSVTANLPSLNGFSYTPATVIKISRNKQHNYLILGQGSEDGILPQSGIITQNGVVGIVDAVGKHYSYAISIKNTELSISARIGKEGAVGPLVWDGKSAYGTILKAIPLQFKFQPGDTVYTSGHSSIFPPDIPLGTIGKSTIVNGATYDINVRLLRNPDAARFVAVVNNAGRSEIEALEKKEGGE